MFRIITFIMLCIGVSFPVHSSDNTFFGKVLEVDGHNVMTVADAKGNLRILSLAYISTPVRGEPYFETVNKHLQTFVGNWYQFTVVRYGRNANVQPVLMRDQEQRSVNSAMVREGMAMVNMATDPPVALIDQNYSASEKKVGLWALKERFNPLSRKAYTKFNLADMLAVKGKRGLVPYVKVEETMTAYPVGCGMAVPNQKFSIALTAHVARREGYRIENDCSSLFN